MTSTTSSYKLPQDVRAQLLSMRGIIILMTCFYMLIGPVASYLATTMVLQGDAGTMPYFAGQTFFQNMYVVFYPTAIFFGAIGAAYVTRYQHVQKQSNFYHSLPISRMNLLTSRIAALIMIQVVLVAVSILLMVVVSGRIPIDGFMLRVGKWAVVHFLHIILTFMLSFGIGLLAGQLTANTISQLLMMGVFHLTIPLIGVTMMAALEGLFETFASKGIAWSLMSFNIFQSMSFQEKMHAADNDPAVGLLAFQQSDILWPIGQYVIFIALTVLSFVLTYYLYKHRKAEKAGETLQYAPVGTFIKVAYVVLGTSIVGFAFYSFGANTTIGFVLGAILAMIIVHTIVEMIYQQDLHGMRRHWGSALLGLVISLAIYGLCISGVIDYDHYVPKSNHIQAVKVDLQLEDSSYNWAMEDAWLHDPAYISAVLEATKQLSDKHIDAEEIGDQMADKSEAQTLRLKDDTMVQSVQVAYQNKLGITTVRRFNVAYKDFQKIYPLVMNKTNYHKALWQTVLDTPDNAITGLSVDGQAMLEQANDTKNLIYSDAKGKILNADPARTSALREAMHKDIEKRTADTMQSGKVGTIYINGMNFGRTFNVYRGDAAINALFDKWRTEGFLPSTTEVAQAVLANNDVLMATIEKNEKGYRERRKVTDVAEVEKLLNEDTVEDGAAVIFGKAVNKESCVVIRPKVEDGTYYEQIRYIIEK